MILGIDAGNIRAGGGVTHLVELLRAARPQAHGFERVIVWSSAATLAQLRSLGGSTDHIHHFQHLIDFSVIAPVTAVVMSIPPVGLIKWLVGGDPVGG